MQLNRAGRLMLHFKNYNQTPRPLHNLFLSTIPRLLAVAKQLLKCLRINVFNDNEKWEHLQEYNFILRHND